MSAEGVSSHSKNYFLTDLLFEAVDETALPAAIGLATAGPAGAVSASSLALGLFFAEKTTQYLLPELKDNKYLYVGKHLIKASFTAVNSAKLMSSNYFCLTKDWVLKSGNFAFDIGKSLCGYLFGVAVNRASDSIQSERVKMAVRTVSGVIVGYITVKSQDYLNVKTNHCSSSGCATPICDKFKSK
ncbi:hypothetical protein JQC92_21255 [Shewanella sp. 202IG2-18]|uniref:hypothetical protein n=1 Tax=Parashewanella hymeniacidonis TaxID=2807618 RepID=UPI001960E5A0|nr:hypothetical protein [Parashewanella hymeniacidonis]MBM7074513.1 hypothetical protein [Parashewanella hymeniacidonis]